MPNIMIQMEKLPPLKQKTYTCTRCGKRFVGRQSNCPRCAQPFVYRQGGKLFNPMGDEVALTQDRKHLVVIKKNGKRPA